MDRTDHSLFVITAISCRVLSKPVFWKHIYILKSLSRGEPFNFPHLPMCQKILRCLPHIVIKIQLGPALQTPSLPEVYNLPQRGRISSQISGPRKQFSTLDVLCGPAPLSPEPDPFSTCSLIVLMSTLRELQTR